jgi:CRP-like cAMP-binding protein
MAVAGEKNGWPGGNLLLSAVPAEERAGWLPLLQPVSLRAGDIVHHVGDFLTHVHFPVECVVATLGISRGGGISGLTLIGNEGVTAANSILGDDVAATLAMVQVSGLAYRLPSSAFRASFASSQVLRSVVLRYLASLAEQMTHTALCNSRHPVQSRLCRWMLQTLDRVSSPDLPMTQQLIATVLGVRREAVTLAALRLQGRGAIRYKRGRIRILDRAVLETACCECYLPLRKEADALVRALSALLPPPAPPARNTAPS